MNMTLGKIGYALFDYQKPARNQIIEWVRANEADQIHTLVSCMRSGKTGIVCNAVSHIAPRNYRVWLCVDRIELVDQWRKSLTDFAPNVKSIGYITTDSNSPGAGVVIVQLQTLARRLENIDQRFAPHIIFYDEAHTTAFMRVANKARLKFPKAIQINLTGTPVRHGSSNVQYDDVFLRKHWFVAATAKQMIQIGRWKVPKYILASPELAAETARRFSGVRIVKGEFDDTAQSKVMIDLLPKHLSDVLPKLGDRTAIWMAVDTNHAQEIYKAITAKGYTTAFISGDEKLTQCNVDLNKYRNCKTNRARIIEAHRDGTVKHLVNICTVTTGYDNPLASAAIWLRKTMSVSLWCQATGRALSSHPDNAEGLIFDMAGNLGIHPCPEDIDWEDFDASTKMFRDPDMYICKKCGYRHESIPVPLHQLDPRNVRFSIAARCFPADDKIKLFETLKCHSCKSPVYHDPLKLIGYGEWLKSIGASFAGGSKVKRFSGISAGISIGCDKEYSYPLTVDTLYDYGVWKTSEEMPERDPYKDKSAEFETVYTKAVETIDNKTLTQQKLALMNDKQRAILDGITVAKINEEKNLDLRYKIGLAVAYVNNYAPGWAFMKFWHNKSQNPSDELLRGFFTKLTQPDGAKKLVIEWLTHHMNKYEEEGNRRSAGLIKGWINKFLN